MLAWIAIPLFLLVAIAMYVFRVPLARGQGLVLGGRIGPGCVIAEAVFFLVGLLVLLYRGLF